MYTDVEELIARFAAGARYRCGCVEGRLHPSIVRGLRQGTLDPRQLYWCEKHGAPMVIEEPIPQVCGIHWSSSD